MRALSPRARPSTCSARNDRRSPRRGAVEATRKLVMALRAPRQGSLGRAAALDHACRRDSTSARPSRALAAARSEHSARRSWRAPPRARASAALQDLQLEAIVNSAASDWRFRPQARARLALDVQRTIEVLLRAVELELRAPASLACLPRPVASRSACAGLAAFRSRSHPPAPAR